MLFRSDEQESQQEIAKTLVNQIAAGKFEMAIEPFTEAMKKALPADKLKQVWDGIISQRGPLKRATEIRNEVIKRLNTVFVTCEFQRSKLETKVSFTDDGEITALFFVPLHEYRPPSYANRSTFEEAEITIGKGFWALPGTLSLPVGDGLFPAVVLVHGAGSLDRDETAGPNKHFRDLAYGLASQGIAVLRCEKRTKHHQLAISVVPRSIATVKEEFVDDALAAVDALAAHDRIDNTRIFVLGHDLGGVLLPRIGTASEKVAGVIIFAGTTRPWEDFVLDQWKYILAFDGKVTEGEQKAIQELEKSVAKVKSPDLSPETAAKDLPLGIPATYWLDLRGYHPAEAAKEMKQPILILQGERDYLVSMEDFAQWKKTLASRKNVTFKSYSNLNHLFIAGEGKSSPADHLVPGNVAEPVIMDIAMWIKSQSL